jgi:hypothetical protein
VPFIREAANAYAISSTFVQQESDTTVVVFTFRQRFRKHFWEPRSRFLNFPRVLINKNRVEKTLITTFIAQLST